MSKFKAKINFMLIFFLFSFFSQTQNLSPSLCLKENGQTKNIFSIIHNHHHNYKSNIYKTAFSPYFIISFDESISDNIYNKIIQDKNTSINGIDKIIETFSGKVIYDAPDIFFTRMYYIDNNNNQKHIDGVKFDTSGEDYHNYRFRTKRYFFGERYLNEFTFFHEFFHTTRYNEQFNSNINEYISDVASVIAISLVNNLNYRTYNRFLNSVFLFRYDQAREFRDNHHYHQELWRKRKLVLSHDNYNDLKKSFNLSNDYYNKIINTNNENNGNCQYIKKNDFNEITAFEKEIIHILLNQINLILN